MWQEKQNKQEFLSKKFVDDMPIGIIQLRQIKDRIDILTYSEGVKRLTGYSLEECINNSAKEYNLLSNQEGLKQIFNFCKKEKQRIELQISHKNEKKLWVCADITRINLEESYLQIALTDITELKQLKVAASLSIDILFEYDIEKDIMRNRINRDGIYTKEQTVLNFKEYFLEKEMIHPRDIHTLELFIEDLQNGRPIITAEMQCKTRSGEFQWMSLKGKTIFHADGYPWKVIGRVINIEKEKQRELTLIDRTNRDPMTKLYNKVTTRELVEKFIKERRKHRISALLIIDVDNFKTINDTLGHLFGDEVLMNIADNIKKLFYSTDVVGRIGGDEFLVFMRDVTQEESIIKKAEEIQQVFTQIYAGENKAIKVTASIGIVCIPKDGIKYIDLFEKADKALYFAKSEGKNRYQFYNELQESNYKKIFFNRQEEGKEIVSEDVIQINCQEFDYEITDFAFRLMEETKDVDSAINLLLRKVAEHYNLTNISIKELQKTEGNMYRMKYIYEYTKEGIPKRINQVKEYTKDVFEQRLKEYNGNGIYQVNDTKNLPEEIRVWYQYWKIKALIQCSFYENGSYVGGVEYTDSENARNWSKKEIVTLKRISRIISAYLLKMRAYEETSAMIERLTGHDEITGLLKYERFIKVAREKVKELLENEEIQLVVIYSDISNFKYVNETYGYAAGDRILRGFAEYIENKFIKLICASRVSSDNIVFLCQISKNMSVESVITQVLAAGEEFSAIQKELYTDSNLIINTGIYFYDEKKEDIVTAIDNANLARKKAKQPKQPKCILFQEDMNQELKKQILFLKDIQKGLTENEFTIFLQPKVDTVTNKIIGAEALIRWVKPDGIMIYPNDFIPVFEKNGSIVELDYYVYQKTFEYINERIKRGKAVVPISMNVSRLHLEDARLIDYIKTLIKKYQVPSELLEFEITESIFIDNIDFAGRMIDEMKELGISISIDDFGSGYSSLNILKRLPIDILKLDKALLDDYDITENGPIIIESIIHMADRMSIKVICEGVETKTQVEFLQKNGCRYVQGYYFSKPVDIAQFNLMLEKNTFNKK